MKPKTVAILALVALLTSVAAGLALNNQRPALATMARGEKLFPGLADKASGISSVVLESGGRTMTFERTGKGGGAAWTLKESDGYAVEAAKLSGLIISLGELELRQAKTKRRDRLAVLDLDDPIESAANAEELAPQPEHEGPAALGEEALAIELAGLEGEALEENDFAQLGLAEELTDPGGSDDPDGAANVSALDEAELSVAGLLDDRGTDLSDGREQWEDAQEIEPQAPLEPPSDLDPGAVGFEEREEDKAILEEGEESPLEALPTGSQTLRTAKVIEGAPVAVGAEALEVEITGRGLGRIPYSRIEAVAVAAVAGLSVRPVLVVDLVLNWNSRLDEPLKVIRIRGNQFDPLSLVPGAPSPLQALKDMIATISGRSGAESLPSEAALDGTPFHRCEDLAQFEAEILGVEG